MNKELRSGVYKLVNLVNNKFYIGSAAGTFKRRWEAHTNELNGKRHHNVNLQSDWDEYGPENFRFMIVQFCKSSECLTQEQYWLDKLKPWETGYNISKRVDSIMFGRTFSVETKVKMSEKRKGIIPIKATEAAAKVNRGTPRPEKIRQKISKSKQGKKLSVEHCESIKKAHWSNRPDAKEIAERSAAKQRGRKQSPELIEKRRQANLRAWALKKALVSSK